MNWDAIGAVGELVGGLVVIFTLIYLSKQIKANSTQLEVSSITDLATLFNDAFLPIYNDEHSMSIWVDGLNNPESLSESDLVVFELFMHRLINPYEVVITHYEKGALDEATFQGYEARIQGLALDTPGGKTWLKRNKNLLSPLLLKYLDKGLPHET